MTTSEFRKIALGLPETSEASHQDHPDFRVGGKIFATLPQDGRGMVVLSPEQQKSYVGADPEVFIPAQGAWGRRGCTYVLLRAANKATVRQVLIAAWKNKAPRKLAEMVDVQ